MNRAVVAAALDRMGVVAPAMWLRRAVSPWLTVLTYHRVVRTLERSERSDDKPGVVRTLERSERTDDAPGASASPTSMLDDGVIDVTPERLDAHLAFIKRWFRAVTIDDVLAFAHRGRRLPENPLLVTFDDGYRDNHDVALPILARRGVPATFFIATDFVESRRVFWWDRLALAIKRSPRDRIELDYPDRLDLGLGDAPARRASVRLLQRLVKDRVGLNLERFIDGVERATGAALGRDEERRIADETVMTWEHVVALRRAGMDVQSHTRTHRVLSTIGPEELASELRGSRAALETALGEPVRALSYPVGKPVGASRAIRHAVQQAGYRLAFSNGTGVNRLHTFDPLDARRMSLDLALGDAAFRAMLAFPPLGYQGRC